MPQRPPGAGSIDGFFGLMLFLSPPAFTRSTAVFPHVRWFCQEREIAVQPGIVVCPNCKQAQPRGGRYCVACGEPIDPALVSELQRLYTTIADLDERIRRDPTRTALIELRDEYREKYLQLRDAKSAAAAFTPTQPRPRIAHTAPAPSDTQTNLTAPPQAQQSPIATPSMLPLPVPLVSPAPPQVAQEE